MPTTAENCDYFKLEELGENIIRSRTEKDHGLYIKKFIKHFQIVFDQNNINHEKKLGSILRPILTNIVEGLTKRIRQHLNEATLDLLANCLDWQIKLDSDALDIRSPYIETIEKMVGKILKMILESPANIPANCPVIICKQKVLYDKLYPSSSANFKFCDNIEHRHEQYTLDMNNDNLNVHAKDSTALVQTLKNLKKGDHTVFIQPNPKSVVAFPKRGQMEFSPRGLTYSAVRPPAPFIQKYCPRSSNGIPFTQENRYGACLLKWEDQESSHVDDFMYFERGTKVYRYEYSQILCRVKKFNFTPEDQANLYLISGNTDKLIIEKLNRIDITNLKLDVTYGVSGCRNWTHSEIMTVGGFQVPLNKIKISFDDSHQCVIKERGDCFDCQHFMSGVELVSDGNEDIQVPESTRVGYFARDIFAYTCPLLCRKELIEIQNQHEIFSKNDFEYIKNIWETISVEYKF